MRIFLGGGVKSTGSRVYLEEIARLLEEAGHEVFLPHRNGSLPGKTGQEKGLLTSEDFVSMGRMVFEGNLAHVDDSDAVVAVVDGLCWGTTLELGYAYAYKKSVKPGLIIIGIYTDPVEKLDIMRFHACDEVLMSYDSLLKVLSERSK